MANNGSGDFIFTTNLYKNPGKDSLLGPKKGKITGKELNKKKLRLQLKNYQRVTPTSTRLTIIWKMQDKKICV